MPDTKLFDVAQEDGITIVKLVNPELLDRLMVNELGDDLIAYVEAESPVKLLIDFENVTYCSSEVIGSLIRTWKRVSQTGGKMKMCGMNGGIRELFKITRLDGSLFDICDSKKAAISEFSESD